MPTCEKTERGRLIVRDENKRKIILLNQANKRIMIIEVDGCKITTGRKCDYLFIDQSTLYEYFVEFKGEDIKYACEQLEATILQLTENIKEKKYAFVIGSRVAPAINTTIQRFRALFHEKYNADLIVSNIKCCFDLSLNKKIDCSRL